MLCVFGERGCNYEPFELEVGLPLHYCLKLSNYPLELFIYLRSYCVESRIVSYHRQHRLGVIAALFLKHSLRQRRLIISPVIYFIGPSD